MARYYPRFLFSNPTNVKSKGAFIVHTLKPFLIVGVYDDAINTSEFTWTKVVKPKHQQQYTLALLTPVDVAYADKIPQILSDLAEWFHFQVKDNHIQL